MIGQRAYEHVRDLAHLGLIDRRRDGLSRRLTTTRRFAEMFGCPYAESKKVRAGLGNMQPRWAWMGLNWQPVWVMGIKKSNAPEVPSVMNGMNPVQKSSKMKKSESPSRSTFNAFSMAAAVILSPLERIISTTASTS